MKLDELHNLGGYRPAVEAALADLAQNNVVARIWEHDHTVWNKDDPREITNRLGWLHVAEGVLEKRRQLDDLRDVVETAGYTDVLLLGMGGSSLAPELFSKTFGGETGGLVSHLAVLDSTAPGSVLAHAGRLDPRWTLFVVSTKSGGTVETLSFFKFFYDWVAQALGTDQAGEHFMAITDPGSGLANLAQQYDFATTFLNDPNIGGRYSALSFFGVAPAVMVGVDVPVLLGRARSMARWCQPDTPLAENPGAVLGSVLGALANAGRDKATFVISPQLASFGDWVEQLIAESTGKEGKGILPVVGEPLGTPEVYGPDRFFVHVRLEGDDSFDAKLQALADAGHPVVRIDVQDTYGLGGQFFLWEFATAVAGYHLQINPFDQPNVEAAKVLARNMVSLYMDEGALPEAEAEAPTRAALDAFMAQAGGGSPMPGSPHGYVAIQAYVQPTLQTDLALQALRTQLRDRYHLATTVGYGPRFLHSTGQLHKGDAGNGLFIQFTADTPLDVPIPDRAGEPGSSMTFGVLIASQAAGDRAALREAGRQVLHFHLGEDAAGGIRSLLR